VSRSLARSWSLLVTIPNASSERHPSLPSAAPPRWMRHRENSTELEFEGPSTATWRYVTDGEPEMFTFIERYYNQTRLHSHNHYRTPNETEADLRDGAPAA
jgi:hypothetical protein